MSRRCSFFLAGRARLTPSISPGHGAIGAKHGESVHQRDRLFKCSPIAVCHETKSAAAALQGPPRRDVCQESTQA